MSLTDRMAGTLRSTLPLLALGWLAGVCTSFTAIKDGTTSSPFFCHGLECPKFEEIYNSTAYQIRMYEPSKWVSTTVTGESYELAAYTAFMKLFDYIQGENDQKVTIPMTAPVINSVQPGEGPVCASNFTFSFFVPFKFQSNTPKPTNKDLFLSTLDQHKVYVRVYHGFTNGTIFPKEAAELAKALNSSQPYDKSLYSMAGYDSPFEVHDRHNEIWYFATDK